MPILEEVRVELLSRGNCCNGYNLSKLEGSKLYHKGSWGDFRDYESNSWKEVYSTVQVGIGIQCSYKEWATSCGSQLITGRLTMYDVTLDMD